MANRPQMTKDQADEVLKAMKKTNIKREYRRLQAIYLYGTGEDTRKIIKITQLTPTTISRLYSKYRKLGLCSIPDAPRKGRPSRLSAEQKSELKALILNKTPSDVGFVANFHWNAKLVQEYILREYKIKYSHKGVTLILARLNLSFTCPTYTLAKADSVKQEQFIQDFEGVKKN